MENAELDFFIEKVNSQSDIVEVISRYVQLNMRGGRYWACCPFHNEKTASFSVTPEKGFFYCFGCHVGGNVFKFLSLIENITYFEAVKLQAERLGIEIPTQNKSEQEVERDSEEKILHKINNDAKIFYHNYLTKTSQGALGRKYLNARGITDDVIEKFQLGFAPDSWDGLSKNFLQRGYKVEELLAAGLVSKRKSGEGVYDRMRARVIIPIANILGQTVGFGGRILNAADEKSPKYLNTPETILFNKRNLLFGLDKAHIAISNKNFAIVVEGYMDAISLWSAGIENVVATLGTAFTPEHAKLIMRYARKIVFCYDSDEAGQKATLRALPIVSELGAEVSVVNIPDGKDPDDFIRKHGKSDFEKIVTNARSLIEYRMNYVLRTIEHSTIEGKVHALKEILPVVLNETDSTRQSEYRKKIASALVLDESVVRSEWQKLSGQDKIQRVKGTKLKIEVDEAIKQAGAVALRVAWQDIDTLNYTLSMVPKNIFPKVQQEIISYLETCLAENRRPDNVTAAVQLSDSANAELSKIIIDSIDDRKENEVAAFDDSVKVLHKAYLKNRHAELLKELNKCMLGGNLAKADEILKSLKKIKSELDGL